jgi:hypothetical protein
VGYTSKPKTLKGGLCKELENHIFDFGVSNVADLTCTMQEKIAQYVGIKYGEDIANKLTNCDSGTTRVLCSNTAKTPGVGGSCVEEAEEHENTIGCQA